MNAQVSLLEIYNEKIQDLLGESSNGRDREDQLKVVRGADGMEVPGLTYVPVCSQADQ